jgi:hypothetical protein
VPRCCKQGTRLELSHMEVSLWREDLVGAVNTEAEESPQNIT